MPTFGVGRECSCSTKILEGLSPAPSMKGLLSPTSVSLPGGWGGGGMAPAWFVSWGLLRGSEHLLLPPQLWPLSQPLISHATPFPTQNLFALLLAMCRPAIVSASRIQHHTWSGECRGTGLHGYRAQLPRFTDEDTDPSFLGYASAGLGTSQDSATRYP